MANTRFSVSADPAVHRAQEQALVLPVLRPALRPDGTGEAGEAI